MIGNDVVDLEAAKRESDWRRPGYLDKIFTPQEQQLILNSTTPDIIVWVLWSMKEAVYKAAYREYPVYRYAPSKITCFLNIIRPNIISGEVKYNQTLYFTETKTNSDYIHTYACKKKRNFATFEIIEIADYPKNYMNYLKEKELLGKNKYLIKDKNNIPRLHDETNKWKHPASIAHHGRYLGIIWCTEYII